MLHYNRVAAGQTSWRQRRVSRSFALASRTADFAYSNYNGIKAARCVVIIRLNNAQQDFVAVVTSVSACATGISLLSSKGVLFSIGERAPDLQRMDRKQTLENSTPRNSTNLEIFYQKIIRSRV